MKRGTLLLAGLVLALPALAAFTERYYFEVPDDGERSLEADFELALGRIAVGEAERGYLFQAEVALEDEDMKPGLDLDVEDGHARLELGFASDSKGTTGLTVRGFKPPEENEWLLFFSRRVPLDLQFELGMAEADLDLTGFQVQRLGIESGMATTRLTFDRPNALEMEELTIDAGMAKFYGERLGNARFRHLTFDGGAGSFVLDFTGGPLPPGAHAEINAGMCALRVVLPEGVPIVLEAPDSWLTRVELPNGFVKRGAGLWHSEAVRDAADAFHVEIDAGVGKVSIVASAD